MRVSMQSCGEKRDGAVGRSAEAGFGRGRREAPWAGGLSLRQPGLAWASPASRGEEEEDEGPRPRYHGRRSDPTNMIVIGGIAFLGLITLLLIFLSVGAGTPTLAELKQKIGIPTDVAVTDFEMPYAVFVNKAGRISEMRSDANYIYLFFKVQEGTARFAVDRGPWMESTQAHIREIRMMN